LLIILARITDVSMGTLRMVAVIQGRRLFATVLGFFEAVVYVCVVAKVLLNMDQPVYAVAYGLGYAAGICLGMFIEQRLAFGKQLVFLLTTRGARLAEVLRAGDYRAAEVQGHTEDGDLTILCVEVQRREAQALIRLAHTVDERCAYIIHDIRLTGVATSGAPKTSERLRSWISPLKSCTWHKRGLS
jgi:uncharacterized protein YebE (UPF0316 family)